MNISNHASYSTPEELASHLKTDLTNGLDWTDCEYRLKVHGHNEFISEESSRYLYRYLDQFKNPLIQLLLFCALVSFAIGERDDAISISLAIIIVVTVAYIQEYRSEQSLKELNRLVPPSCRAIRNGRHEEFLAKYLVPGDVVLISTGDRIPADLILVESHQLSIDESNLTGETEPAQKSPMMTSSSNPGSLMKQKMQNGDINSNFQLVDSQNSTSSSNSSGGDGSCSDNNGDSKRLAFMGTLVQTGHGKGVVIGTGDKTQFGSVFKLMQSEEAPLSPLQQNMNELGKHLSIYSLCIIFVIVVIGWFQSRPIVEMFTIGVSLAVAAIPEGLPIVVTVTLALGVMRMARRKAVVKHLPAVETLGCVHIICTDKTGTLTKNEMTVTHISTSESYQADVTGVGYHEMGDVILNDHSNNDHNTQMDSIKRLMLALTQCNNAKFDPSGKLLGQATEGAIVVAAKKLGLHNSQNECVRLEEIPFSSEHKYMAVKCRVVEQYGNDDESMMNNDGAQYYVKGAIEVILSKCTSYSNCASNMKLTESHKQDIRRQSEIVESRGLRVLAAASGSSLDKLTYLGFIGILDPPRSGVKECLDTLRESGIQVKMITGDSKITAQSIARMLGLMGPGSQAMSGQDIDDLMSDKSRSLLERAEDLANVSLFYRVTPNHKLTIVKMLQSLNYITAMTGDGVNDGVALKKADIGISMGSGTDVCKEAADVILMNDDLSTIVVALEEGKGIYHNIRNFIKFQLSTSIAALSLIAFSTIFHVPNPLNPMQILYINILMDGPPAQSLGVEQVDQDVLKQPPRNVKEPVLTKELLVSVFISAAVIVAGTMLVFISEMSDGVVTPRDTTMTFTCFVLFDLFNALTCRSQTKSILEIGFFTNRTFLFSIGGSLVGQLLVIYCPPVQSIFQTEALSLMDLVYLVTISSSVFLVSEAMKLFKNRSRRRRIRMFMKFQQSHDCWLV
uniref:Calcium-transporting ATPase n=1 Tax=Aceria tosichella TaxID=561515 RepID=A0A6G1SGI9_9ACAR